MNRSIVFALYYLCILDFSLFFRSLPNIRLFVEENLTNFGIFLLMASRSYIVNLRYNKQTK